MAYLSKGDKTKGIVDMHPIGDIKLSKFKWISLDKMFMNLLEKNEELNKKFETQREINKGLIERINIIERKLKANGII